MSYIYALKFPFHWYETESVEQERYTLAETGCWVSERFNTVFWGRKAVPVKVLRVSGCSWCTRAQGGPSHAMERLGARGSSRRTLLGHRRGSGAWTAWQWTRAGSCGTTGCPGQEPSRQDELRLSLGLKGGWKINAPHSQVWKLYMTPHPVCLSLYCNIT